MFLQRLTQSSRDVARRRCGAWLPKLGPTPLVGENRIQYSGNVGLPVRADAEFAKTNVLPPLPLDSWADTLATVHMWTQIVGKVRLGLWPLVNHWWNVPFYVTGRGLTTSLMPCGPEAVEIFFDFIDHKLWIETSEGELARARAKPAECRRVLPCIHGGDVGA